MGRPIAHACLALCVFIGIAFALGVPRIAAAEGATFHSVRLEATDEGYQLDAELDISLTAGMQEAVRKGVPLYFVVEFELTRNRWYWLDQVVARATRERRIGFAPLTDQYRVTVSGVSQNVSSFDEVKRILSRVRSWTVLEKGRLKPGEKYQAAVRFRLDTSQLPKPFQLNVLASKEWSLSSDWYRWTVSGDDKP
ncbi:MAG TPA: DUF4390 domain-containing protein [Usitatibacteraceae bacterium]